MIVTIQRRLIPYRQRQPDPTTGSGSGLAYPNRFARYLLRAMAVEMGENGLRAVLKQAWGDYDADPIPPNTLAKTFPFERLAALNHALDSYYGQDDEAARIGRGMALRIGRAWFYQGMKNFGALAGIKTHAVERLLPEQRARLALEAAAHIFTHFSDQTSWLDESDRVFRFIIDPCATAWGLSAPRPICQTMVGLLQECVRWASDQELVVRETNCRAVEGGACIFVINKQPAVARAASGTSGE